MKFKLSAILLLAAYLLSAVVIRCSDNFGYSNTPFPLDITLQVGSESDHSARVGALTATDGTFSGDVGVTGDITVDDITGDVAIFNSINGGATMTVTNVFATDVFVDGNTYLGGGYGDTGCDITATGTIWCNGHITIGGTITAGSANFISGVYTSNIAASGYVRAVYFSATGNGSNVLGTLGVTGLLTATGGIQFGSNSVYFVNSSGAASFSSGTIAGLLTMSGAAGDITFNNAGGFITLAGGNISDSAGSVNVNDDVAVSGDVAIEGFASASAFWTGATSGATFCYDANNSGQYITFVNGLAVGAVGTGDCP